MHKFWGLGTLIFTGASLLAAPAAWAATETQNLSVTATVTNTCGVSSSNTLAFGAVEPSSSTPKDAQVTINITCTAAPASATLQVGDGQNGGLKTTVPGARAMVRTGGANNVQNDLLAYRLYTDSARTTEISTATGTTSTINLTAGTNMDTTIYGRVPPSQTVGAFDNASFTDTILLTLEYSTN